MGRSVIDARRDRMEQDRFRFGPGWAAGLRPPDRRPIYEWAADNVILPEAYALPGPFDVSPSRYMIAPLEAVQNDAIRTVSCNGAIQTGKSLIVEIAIPWAIANAPGPIMWTMQSDPDAKEQAQTRFNELLKRCKPVAALMDNLERHKAKTTETYFGSFFLLLNGANLNNLQSKSIRWKFNSEVWLWKQGLLDQAVGRVSKFEETQASKVFNESQGGNEGDDMDRAWNAGSQSLWSVRCAGCNALLPLEFFARCEGEAEKHAGMIWDASAKRPDGTYNVGQAADSARWRCKKCGHEHGNTARTRATWNASGEYVAQNPSAPADNESFRWNALVSRDFGSLVAQWLGAVEQKRRGLLVPMQDFWRKRLALPWKPEQEEEKIVLLKGGYNLADHVEKPDAKIAGEAIRIMTIDRQRDHFWVLIRAWRHDGSSRLLYFSRAQTEEQAKQVGESYGVESSATFEDAQHNTAKVYEDCIRFGWVALHGSGEDGFDHILKSKKKVQRFYSTIKTASVPGGLARYIFWASEPVKDILQGLKLGAGASWEVADDASPEYRKQINGDRKRERINKKNGRPEMFWTRVGENHAWDCEAMQVAAALMFRIISAPETEVK